MKTAIVIMALLVGGCEFEGSYNDVHPERTYRTVEIEGHEYIFISRRPYAGEMAIAHKANCKAEHE